MAKRPLRAGLLLLYLLLVLAPLILLLIRPGGREFLRELSVALGFVGLSLMGLQLLPTARLPWVANTFPMDRVYRFHHMTSILATVLIVAHPAFLVLNSSRALRLLNPITSPERIRLGVWAVLLLIVLVGTSVWRRPLRIPYEPWRLAHNVLTLGAVVLSLYHIFAVGFYLGTLPQRVLWVGLIVLWAGLYLYIRLVSPLMLLRKPYRVREVRPERGNSWTVAVEPVGHPGFRFAPGQFAWLRIGASPFGLHENPFSFASSAEQEGVLEFGIKELGDFTATIGDIRPGTPAYVDGPYGVFGVDSHPDAPAYVFIAGGIGITPILSMLHTLADRGDRRPLYLFYGNPSWEAVIYREEIERLQERLNLTVVHVLEQETKERQTELGYVTADILDRHLPEDRTGLEYFACGPLPMLDFLRGVFRRLGVPGERIHTEHYEMA